MWVLEESRVAHASRDAIWAHWTDVITWSSWNPAIASSMLEGPFQVGATGSIKPVRGAESTFVITECVPGRKWVSESKIPFGRLIFEHELTDEDGKLRITHRNKIAGPLAFLWGRLLGKNLAYGHAEAVSNLAAGRFTRH